MAEGEFSVQWNDTLQSSTVLLPFTHKCMSHSPTVIQIFFFFPFPCIIAISDRVWSAAGLAFKLTQPLASLFKLQYCINISCHALVLVWYVNMLRSEQPTTLTEVIELYWFWSWAENLQYCGALYYLTAISFQFSFLCFHCDPRSHLEKKKTFCWSVGLALCF